MLSDDEGRTWRRSREITVDTPRGVMEMQIVETAPDRLFCLFRTKGGYLYQTFSEDGGETWSKSVPSPLPAPESMARMIKLQSGNLLVVWNNVSSTTQQPRHPLSAALSKDSGRTWGAPKVIAEEAGANQLSNHGLIELDDGRILLGISHYRDVRPMTSDLDMAIFDEIWLAAQQGGCS
jgi:sialidase-1